jgi:chaperone required for assembly of F1-ATPase
MRGPEETVQAARRFYKAVTVEAVPGGFAVKLDGRSPKSPGGLPMILPTQALAELIAGEWGGQGEFILLGAMPATRLAFTAIERTAGVRVGLAAEVARFAGSDALCYFADAPVELIARQHAAWGPLLDWAESALAIPLVRAEGIIHRAQPPESIARVKSLALDLDDFNLIALTHATALFGSAVLALALQRGRLGWKRPSRKVCGGRMRKPRNAPPTAAAKP